MAWFVLAYVAVVPAIIGWALTAFFPLVDNASGTDMTVEDGVSPVFVRVLAAIASIAGLMLPWFVARWARKIWLGYLLLGWCIVGVVLVIGLFMFRIL